MTGEAIATGRKGFNWRRFLDKHRDVVVIYGILILIVLLALIFLPEFRNARNMFNILRQSVALGIVSVGQTVAILIGGIDLSVGATISLIDVYATGFMERYTALGLVVLMVAVLLSLGMLIGFINANVITRLRVAPFIATLGMGAILQGMVLMYTKRPGGDIAPGWEFFAEGMVGPIPVPVVFYFVLVAATWGMLAKTVWGRHIKATGGSELIARLSGVETRRIITYAYMFCSLMAAVTGLYLTSRMGAGDPRVGGLQYERFDLDFYHGRADWRHATGRGQRRGYRYSCRGAHRLGAEQHLQSDGRQSVPAVDHQRSDLARRRGDLLGTPGWRELAARSTRDVSGFVRAECELVVSGNAFRRAPWAGRRGGLPGAGVWFSLAR